MRPITQQIKAAREERILDQTQANRELVRNLAHEIRNPLGGIRGAAQLLDAELDRADLRENTRVVMHEADRLQSLMDRMLTPHRLPQLGALNIHEVLERVRSLIMAEFPSEIRIRRDYDTSLPLLSGDREQILQAVLNIVRNAAQAMGGRGEIRLRTRIARSVTLARRRYRQAITLQVIDDGPGIPEAVRERVFYPLVSGRDGGSGLGLTLAQTFINQHHGTIEFESVPGNTCFTVTLPFSEDSARSDGAMPGSANASHSYNAAK
jgi:two-component system nitrogen regulation sensor histidine kinase GlnL